MRVSRNNGAVLGKGVRGSCDNKICVLELNNDEIYVKRKIWNNSTCYRFRVPAVRTVC